MENKQVDDIRNYKPEDFDDFVKKATQIFVEKNTDYDSRFVKGLNEYGNVIYKWEVDKKLDRIRSWSKRGVLLANDDGIFNAVVDTFNYTIQFHMWRHSYPLFGTTNVITALTADNFSMVAAGFASSFLCEYLMGLKLLGDEDDVKLVFKTYMGD